jgi:nicotinamidase-related amidase
MAEKAEHMKTNIKPALLVIDVQNRYIPIIPPREKEKAFFFINQLIDLFRKHGLPIIRIHHSNAEDGPRPGTEEFEYPSQILVKKGDAMIIKTYSDGFNKTDLDDVLKKNGSNTLFLCGLSAVGCVMATRIGAFNHDYKAFVVKDAIMSHNSDYTKNVEMMFDAVSYDVIKLILENCHNTEA